MKEKKMPMARLGFLFGLALLGATTAAQSQDSVASFYKGKTITVVVGTSAGGGYDT